MFLTALTAPPAWYLREKGVGDTPAAPQALTTRKTTLGAFTVTETTYAIAHGRAYRLVASDGQAVAAVYESITTDAPRAVYTPRALPAVPNLSCNVVSRDRLVLRADTGAKLFRLFSTVDGTKNEGAGLLLPDGLGEGWLRFSFYSGLYGYGTRHTAAYAVCEDTLGDIVYWHIEGEGAKSVFDKAHAPRITLCPISGGVCLETGDHAQNFYEE